MSEVLAKITDIKNDLTLSQVGELFANSGFFQDCRQAAQAITKIMAGVENGFGPFTSMSNIHIVKGKLEMGVDIYATAIKRSQKYNYRIVKLDNTVCSIEFFEKSEFTGGKWKSVGVSTFSMDDAKQAGLLDRKDKSGKPLMMFQQYSRNMLFARAMSNGQAWYCPDVFQSRVYSEGEISGEPPEEIQQKPVTIESNKSLPELEKIYEEIISFLDSLDVHPAHRKNSFRAHLGVKETLRECKDIEKLKAYLKLQQERAEQAKETKKNGEQTVDVPPMEQEEVEGGRHRIINMHGEGSAELAAYEDAVKNENWNKVADYIAGTM